jgi:hypothetical protein
MPGVDSLTSDSGFIKSTSALLQDLEVALRGKAQDIALAVEENEERFERVTQEIQAKRDEIEHGKVCFHFSRSNSLIGSINM